MVTLLAVLAANEAPRSGSSAGAPMFIGLMVMMLVFFFVLQRGSRRSEEKKRRELLDSLKRNDRVMTHSGIIGTVVAIKEREIVLKVDESTNTKMTFLKDAIRQVIDESTTSG